MADPHPRPQHEIPRTPVGRKLIVQRILSPSTNADQTQLVTQASEQTSGRDSDQGSMEGDQEPQALDQECIATTEPEKIEMFQSRANERDEELVNWAWEGFEGTLYADVLESGKLKATHTLAKKYLTVEENIVVSTAQIVGITKSATNTNDRIIVRECMKNNDHLHELDEIITGVKEEAQNTPRESSGADLEALLIHPLTGEESIRFFSLLMRIKLQEHLERHKPALFKENSQVFTEHVGIAITSGEFFMDDKDNNDDKDDKDNNDDKDDKDNDDDKGDNKDDNSESNDDDSSKGKDEHSLAPAVGRSYDSYDREVDRFYNNSESDEDETHRMSGFLIDDSLGGVNTAVLVGSEKSSVSDSYITEMASINDGRVRAEDDFLSRRVAQYVQPGRIDGGYHYPLHGEMSYISNPEFVLSQRTPFLSRSTRALELLQTTQMHCAERMMDLTSITHAEAKYSVNMFKHFHQPGSQVASGASLNPQFSPFTQPLATPHIGPFSQTMPQGHFNLYQQGGADNIQQVQQPYNLQSTYQQPQHYAQSQSYNYGQNVNPIPQVTVNPVPHPQARVTLPGSMEAKPQAQPTGGEVAGSQATSGGSGGIGVVSSEPRGGVSTNPDQANPLEMATSYSLNLIIKRYQQFLLLLKDRRSQCVGITMANKTSNEIYKDLKKEFNILEKDAGSTMYDCLKANLSSSTHINQLKTMLESDRVESQGLLNLLQDTLALKIGQHSDTKSFNLAVASLPKNVSLTRFSCPSFFDLSLQFLTLYNANPVGAETYMPHLYSLLSEKNSAEISNIRITENPKTYVDFFNIILQRHCTTTQTLIMLENRQREIGQLATPLTPAQFKAELDKSTRHIQVINQALSWIEIIFRFFPKDIVFTVFLQGPHSSQFLQSLRTHYVSTKIQEVIGVLNQSTPAQQFSLLCNLYHTNHSNLTAYINSVSYSMKAHKALPDTSTGGAAGGGVGGQLGNQANRKVRSINYTSQQATGGQTSNSSGNKKQPDYFDRKKLNNSLAKVFHFLQQNWSRNPPRLEGTNRAQNESTLRKLTGMGIDKDKALLIDKLMLIECPVCIDYCHENTKDIQSNSVQLFPHFLHDDPRQRNAEGNFSKKLYNCPTFLSHNKNKKNTFVKKFHVCDKCLFLSNSPSHLCAPNGVCKTSGVHKLLCDCNACEPSSDFFNQRYLTVQSNYKPDPKKYLQRANYAEVIPTPSNSVNHVSNHIDIHCVNMTTKMQFSTLSKMQSSVNVQMSNLSHVSRFSVVFIRGEAFVHDLGATVSTGNPSTISKFFNCKKPDQVSMRVANGQISQHYEHYICLPLKHTNTRKNSKPPHMLTSILSVINQFDTLPEVDTKNLSDMLFQDFQKRYQHDMKDCYLTRDDFPNTLPKVMPKGLLSVRDCPMRVIASHRGTVAWLNPFEGQQKVVLSGPLHPELVNFELSCADINHSDCLSSSNLIHSVNMTGAYTPLSKNDDGCQIPTLKIPHEINLIVGNDARLLKVKSTNLLCLPLSIKCFLDFWSQSVLSTKQMLTEVNTYIERHFDKLLELSFTDLKTGIERQTSTGLVTLFSAEQYMNFANSGTQYMREDMEIEAFARCYNLHITVFTSSTSYQHFNQSGTRSVKLLLKLDEKHFYPIFSGSMLRNFEPLCILLGPGLDHAISAPDEVVCLSDGDEYPVLAHHKAKVRKVSPCPGESLFSSQKAEKVVLSQPIPVMLSASKSVLPPLPKLRPKPGFSHKNMQSKNGNQTSSCGINNKSEIKVVTKTNDLLKGVLKTSKTCSNIQRRALENFIASSEPVLNPSVSNITTKKHAPFPKPSTKNAQINRNMPIPISSVQSKQLRPIFPANRKSIGTRPKTFTKVQNEISLLNPPSLKTFGNIANSSIRSKYIGPQQIDSRAFDLMYPKLQKRPVTYPGCKMLPNVNGTNSNREVAAGQHGTVAENLNGAGDDSLVAAMSKRPTHIISSRITKTCIDFCEELQHLIMEILPDISGKVCSEALHITHLVISESEKIQGMFRKATNTIRKLNQNDPVTFQFEKVRNFHGNIVVTISGQQFMKIQEAFQSECDEAQIDFDPEQSYHITLFRKAGNIQPNKANFSLEDIPISMNKFILEKVELCDIKRKNKDKYFNIIQQELTNSNAAVSESNICSKVETPTMPEFKVVPVASILKYPLTQPKEMPCPASEENSIIHSHSQRIRHLAGNFSGGSTTVERNDNIICLENTLSSPPHLKTFKEFLKCQMNLNFSNKSDLIEGSIICIDFFMCCENMLNKDNVPIESQSEFLIMIGDKYLNELPLDINDGNSGQLNKLGFLNHCNQLRKNIVHPNLQLIYPFFEYIHTKLISIHDIYENHLNNCSSSQSTTNLQNSSSDKHNVDDVKNIEMPSSIHTQVVEPKHSTDSPESNTIDKGTSSWMSNPWSKISETLIKPVKNINSVIKHDVKDSSLLKQVLKRQFNERIEQQNGLSDFKKSLRHFIGGDPSHDTEIAYNAGSPNLKGANEKIHNDSVIRSINITETDAAAITDDHEMEDVEVNDIKNDQKNLLNISHLLDPPQRLKLRYMSLRCEIFGPLNHQINDIKKNLSNNLKNVGPFLTKENFVNITIRTDRCVEKPQTHMFSKLFDRIKAINISGSCFSPVQEPGILYLDLSDWGALDDIDLFCNNNNLHLCDISIPLIQSVGHDTCPDLVNDLIPMIELEDDRQGELKGGHLFLVKTDGFLDEHLATFDSCELRSGLCKGDLIKIINFTREDKISHTHFGDCFVMFADKIILFKNGAAQSFNIFIGKHHSKLKKLKLSAEPLAEINACLICEFVPNDDTALLIHLAREHSFGVGSNDIFKGYMTGECTMCSNDSLRNDSDVLLHLATHSESRAYLHKLSNVIYSGILRIELGDLQHQPVSKHHVLLVSRDRSTATIPESIHVCEKIEAKLHSVGFATLTRTEKVNAIERIISNDHQAVLFDHLVDLDNTLSREQLNELVRAIIYTDSCPVNKCDTCSKCLICRTASQLSASEKVEKQLLSENPTLQGCISIARNAEVFGHHKDSFDATEISPDPTFSPLKVVTRVPLDQSRVHLLGNNLRDVQREFDGKFRNFSDLERQEFDGAFLDQVDTGLFQRLDRAPKEIRDYVESHPNKHYLSLAPAYKDSKSTAVRCTVNASKLNRNNVSLNSLTLCGTVDLNLGKVFRKFRSHKYGITCDLKKFFNATWITKESLPFQLISYREGCRPDGDWITYMVTKLQYGIKSSSYLSHESLSIITEFGRLHCKCFNKEEVRKESTLGNMSIEMLLKVKNKLGKFDSDDLPYSPGLECNGIFHIFEQFCSHNFVDDFLPSFEYDIRQSLMDYTVQLLGIFGFRVKGFNLTGEAYNKENPTLDEDEGLNLAGYRYFPSKDEFKLKDLVVTNGTKSRGRVKKSRHSKTFFLETIDNPEKASLAYIKQLFEESGTTPTIRLLVSRASAVFDHCGILGPLIAQTRKLTAELVVLSKGNWNYTVPAHGFELFLDFLTELSKACQFRFPRFPKDAHLKGGMILRWYFDGSPTCSLINKYFLSYPTANGEYTTHLLHSFSHVTPPGLSAPKCEAAAASVGSDKFKQIYGELKNYLSKVAAFSDSLVLIWWTLTEPEKLRLFEKNRVDHLITALKVVPSNMYMSTPGGIDHSQSWKNCLFWLSNSEQIADLGTKFRCLGDSAGSGSPIIRASQVSPDSDHFLGPRHCKEGGVTDLWEKGLTRSAAYYEKTTKIVQEDIPDNLEGDYTTGLKKDDTLASGTQVEIITHENKVTKLETFFCERIEPNVSMDPKCEPVDKAFATPVFHASLEGRIGSYSSQLAVIHETPLQKDDIEFNYPCDPEIFINRKLSSVYLILLVVIRFKRLLLRSINRLSNYTSVSLPKNLPNFMHLAPPVQRYPLLIEVRPDNQFEVPVGGQVTSPILEEGGGKLLTEVLRDDKTPINRNSFNIFRTAPSDPCPESALRSMFLHKIDIYNKARTAIFTSLKLSSYMMKTSNDEKCEGNISEQLNNFLKILFYIVAFLSYEGKVTNGGGAFILEDLMLAIIMMAQAGLGEHIRRGLKTLSSELCNDKIRLMSSLPQSRVQYLKENQVKFEELYCRSPLTTKYAFKRPRIAPFMFFKEISDFHNCNHELNKFLAIRTSLEVLHFTKEPIIKNKCIHHAGLIFLRNRTFHQNDIESMLSLKLADIQIAPNILAISPYSPIFKAIFNQLHEGESVLPRPTNQLRSHSGLPITSIKIAKNFGVLSGKEILKTLIESCQSCKIRRRKFNKTELLSTSPLALESHPIVGALYQCDLLPSISLAAAKGTGTRSAKLVKVHLLAMIDRASRFIMLEICRSRNVTDIIAAMHSLFAKYSAPTHLLCDQESSFVSLARTSGWPISPSGFQLGPTNEIIFLFSPATGDGHSRSGLVEQVMGTLRLQLGGQDLVGAGVDILQFGQIISILSHKLNSIPLAAKRNENPDSFVSRDFCSVLTPQLLFSGLRTFPLELPDLKTGTLNFILKENAEIAQRLLNCFVIAHHREPFTKDSKAKSKVHNFQPGDLVGFLPRGKTLSYKACDRLRIGIIFVLSDIQADQTARTAVVRYCTVTQRAGLSTGVKQFFTSRKLSNIIHILTPGSSSLSKNISEELRLLRRYDSKLNKHTVPIDVNTQAQSQIDQVYHNDAQQSVEYISEDEDEVMSVDDQGAANQSSSNGHVARKVPRFVSRSFLFMACVMCVLCPVETIPQNTLTQAGHASDELGLGLATVEKVGPLDSQSNVGVSTVTLAGHVCPNTGQKIDVNLAQLKECRQDRFSSYRKERKVLARLIHVPKIEEVITRTCAVKVNIEMASCVSPPNISKFFGKSHSVTSFLSESHQMLMISPRQCDLAHNQGKLSLKLGSTTVHAKNLVVGGNDLEDVFLHNSTVSQKRGYTSCAPALGLVYYNSTTPYGPNIGQVVRALISIALENEVSFIDYRSKMLVTQTNDKFNLTEVKRVVPYLGLSRDKVKTVLFYFKEDPRETCAKILGETQADFFQSSKEEDLDILKVTSKDTSVGLQLSNKTSNCNELSNLSPCLITQFSDLCVSLLFNNSLTVPPERMLPHSKISLDDFLEGKGSAPLSHFQTTVDKSISNILLNICKENRNQLQSIVNDFESKGDLLTKSKGTKYQVSRSGELGSLTPCLTQSFKPIPLERNGTIICCEEQPVTTNFGILFLQPLKRYAVKNCRIIECSLSPTFILDDGNLVRQSNQGLVFRSGAGVAKLDPSLGLQLSRLPLLNLSQWKISQTGKEANFQEASSRASGVLGFLESQISSRILHCTVPGQPGCGDRLQGDWKDEMFKALLPNALYQLSMFWSSNWGTALHATLIAWGAYVLLTGVINCLTRLWVIACKPNESLTCLGCTSIVCHSIDESLNPNSLQRFKQKRARNECSAKHVELSHQIQTLKNIIIDQERRLIQNQPTSFLNCDTFSCNCETLTDHEVPCGTNSEPLLPRA